MTQYAFPLRSTVDTLIATATATAAADATAKVAAQTASLAATYLTQADAYALIVALGGD